MIQNIKFAFYHRYSIQFDGLGFNLLKTGTGLLRSSEAKCINKLSQINETTESWWEGGRIALGSYCIQ